MKIEKVKIKNFRSYRDEIVIPFKNLNIFLWKNDIGKSTILEALDIFFNDKKACCPISMDDINQFSWENDVEISVCFSDFWENITIDTVSTRIQDEYLLNEEWLLEIKKIYSWATLKPVTYIVAKHPSNDDILESLLNKKITELKQICRDKAIHAQDERRSASLRKAIRDSYDRIITELQCIPVDKEWGREIREVLQKQLPTYSLFQSDRSNSDQDTEVQNPMKIALNNILAKPEILDRLRGVFDEVMWEMQRVAQGTLEKLRILNPDLANMLSPRLQEFEKLSWDKPFWKTEISSDEIPLNKRWSGVKRMILLSFFLNEVERRRDEEWLTDIIYAFEEPETSQHPEHQSLLINAFKTLSETDWVQVILTTHSPYVYKELAHDRNINLLHIYMSQDWIKEIKNIFDSFSLFPHSPTWGEINYFVYGLPTFEFFDELYSRLEELNTEAHVDDFIVNNNSKSITKSESWNVAESSWVQKLDRNNNPVVWQATYITCIRHQIHHPSNGLNSDYKPRLKEWIDDMIAILRNFPR